MSDLCKRNKLTYGVGINDADYSVYKTEIVGGATKNVWVCPFYLKWINMLERCYSRRQQIKNPTYIGCTVCPEWLYLSNFKAWMEQQDWEGKQLDKDILIRENKIYSPETCVFVDASVNLFLTERTAARGDWPIGVNWHIKVKKFQANCGDVLTGKKLYLGLFETSEEAHQAWLECKLRQAHILASQQADERVAKALIKRYSNYTNDNKIKSREYQE